MLAVLWRTGPLPYASLIEQVQAAHPWAPTTIKTLVGRLVQKKALGVVRDGPRQRYQPRITREEFVRDEARRLADRVLEGDLEKLLTILGAH